MELQVLWTNALKIALVSVTKFMFPPKKKEGLICIYHQVAQFILFHTQQQGEVSVPRESTWTGPLLESDAWLTRPLPWAVTCRGGNVTLAGHGELPYPLSPALVPSPCLFLRSGLTLASISGAQDRVSGIKASTFCQKLCWLFPIFNPNFSHGLWINLKSKPTVSFSCLLHPVLALQWGSSSFSTE